MSVKIRMKRFGRTHRPSYRIVVMDERSARDGATLEDIGHYDPIVKDKKNFALNKERAAYWLSVGAQPSETVLSFLKREGLWPRITAVQFYNDAVNARKNPPAPVAEAAVPPTSGEETK